MGLILFVPVLWSISIRSIHFKLELNFRLITEFLLVCAVSVVVFAQSEFPLLFLIPPVLVILAFSDGIKAASLGLLAITFIAVPFTLADSGPTSLMQADMIAKVLVLQVFLAANSILALSVGGMVSDRKRLVRQLERSADHLKRRARIQRELIGKSHLAEQMSGVGHWSLNPDTSSVYWSPEVYAIHGVSPDDFDPNYGDAVLFYEENDRKMVDELVAHSIANAEGWEFEATIELSTGDRRRVHSIGECLKDEKGQVEVIFGVFRDITEEKRVYEELAERELQYRILAEHSTDIVVTFGLDGKITFASPSCKILGVTPEQAIGMSTIDFVIPEDKEFAIQITQQLFTGAEPDRSIRREFRVRTHDGGVIWLEGNPTVMRDDTGQPIAIISTFRDVTERREREDALAAARIEAEAATEAKTDFLSNMSHEIRTPLNGILGFTKLVCETDLNEEQADYLNNIRSAGTMLREIVDDILDFSKVEAGRIEIDTVPFSLNEAVEDVVSLVKAARLNSRAVISHKVHADEPIFMMGDETRLRQVLTNIIGNAAKFTEAGSIDVNASIEGEQIVITVKDTGPGIPKDKLDRVFEGFRQADSTITRKYGGSGLGLSISRSLARLMGGDLTLDSVEGEGTTVTIKVSYVPAAPGSAPNAPLYARHTEDVEASARIMVIDDVEMNLRLVQAGLKHTNYEVATFTSARAAIAQLEAGADFDLVFMDVQMPDIDGLTATKLIRGLEGPISDVPIIALTAHALPSHIKECLDAGMNEHFSKPVDLDKMKALIARLLSAPQTPAESPADNDPLQALREKYKGYLATLPTEFDTILQNDAKEDAARAVAALAHAVAGTSGSFGFDSVSEAAFELESYALMQLNQSRLDVDGLREQVEQFVQASQQQIAA